MKADNEMSKKKISFQGAHGAYSDLSCRTVFPDFETVPCHSFEEAFRKVQDSECDLAMIPVDNTIAGRVADVHHLLPLSNLHIIGEHFQPVRHCLLGTPDSTLSTIKNVHSHIHALPQCRKIIKELGLNAHVHADTAGSAKDIAATGDPEHAAIASSLAAEIYDLKILREDVQDENHNTTRFLILSPEDIKPQYEEDKSYVTSMTFEVRNIPAALYKALGGFATNGLSMSKLESYVGENFQVARFYCDVDGHIDTKAFQLTLEELDFFAKEIRIFGTYPAHSFRKAAA